MRQLSLDAVVITVYCRIQVETKERQTMNTATFNAAIEWIAMNDDEAAGNPEFPLITESMVADLFGTSTEHVCVCVERYRAYVRDGQTPPRMKSLTSAERHARANGGAA
jgi:hypothetical protein